MKKTVSATCLNEDGLIFLIICRGSLGPILCKQFVEVILLGEGIG
jgi:hypothetical protein